MITETIPIRHGPISGHVVLNLGRIITQHNRGQHRRHRCAALTMIADLVCAEFHIGKDELLSHDRTGDIAWPRQVAMSIAMRSGHEPLGRVAEFFRRDRTTLLYSASRVQNRCDTEPKTKELVDRITEKLRERI